MKIMVIDNQVLFRGGVISLLKDQRDMQIVAESDVSLQAVQKALECGPDIILMDPGFLCTEAIDLMKKVHLQRPEIAFIILTTQDSDKQFYDMIKNGAKGYLPKQINKTVLLSALRALGRGEAVIPRGLVTKVLDEFARLGKLIQKGTREQDVSLLTHRELEVLELLRSRATNREIAQQLVISENTVRVHVRNILEKLEFRNRREASDFARGVELFDVGPTAGVRLN